MCTWTCAKQCNPHKLKPCQKLCADRCDEEAKITKILKKLVRRGSNDHGHDVRSHLLTHRKDAHESHHVLAQRYSESGMLEGREAPRRELREAFELRRRQLREQHEARERAKQQEQQSSPTGGVHPMVLPLTLGQLRAPAASIATARRGMAVDIKEPVDASNAILSNSNRSRSSRRDLQASYQLNACSSTARELALLDGTICVSAPPRVFNQEAVPALIEIVNWQLVVPSGSTAAAVVSAPIAGMTGTLLLGDSSQNSFTPLELQLRGNLSGSRAAYLLTHGGDGGEPHPGVLIAAASTTGAWAPMAQSFPELSLPRMSGTVTIEQGNLTISATHTAIASIVVVPNVFEMDTVQVVLGVSGAPPADEIPSGLVVSMSGNVRIGGGNGFVASLTGSIDSSDGSMQLTISHDGGWSPVSWLSTPAFTGYIGMGVTESDVVAMTETTVHLRVTASTTLPDITLIPSAFAVTNPTLSVGVYQEVKDGPIGFTVDMAGTVQVGGTSGFTAALTGSVDTGAQSVAVTIAHVGGWSPLAGQLASYFRTPAFSGLVRLNMPSLEPDDLGRVLYLDVQASATLLSPINLVPGVVSICGQPPDGIGNGPTFAIQMLQPNAGDPYEYTVSVEAAFQIGSGAGAPPLLMLTGEFTSSGAVTLAMSTASMWQPLPGALPALQIPALEGSLELGDDGSIYASATHVRIPQIVFGPILKLTRWQVTVDMWAVPSGVASRLRRRLQESPPSAKWNETQLDERSHRLARRLGSSGTSYTFTVNASGGMTIGESLKFDVIGTLSSQSAELVLTHPGGWCPFRSLGVDFCTPPIFGRFRIGQHPDREPEPEYMTIGALSPMSSPLSLIPGVVTLTDSATATHNALGTAGPTFGVRVVQLTERSSPVFDAYFEGAMCVSLAGTLCFPIEAAATFPAAEISITGTYAHGDIRPLFFLPGALADVAVIRANPTSPLTLTMGISPSGDCQLTLGFGATLEFNAPAAIGGFQLVLPTTVVGCAVGEAAVIITAAIPTITLPGGINFEGLELALSTYSGDTEHTLQPRPGSTVGTTVVLPTGITIFWQGPSPLEALCPQEIVLQFAFGSPSSAHFKFLCSGFSLTLLDRAPIQIPTVNFLRFTSIGISASIQPGTMQFGVSSDFMIATGDSMCSTTTEAECVTATIEAGVETSAVGTIVSLSLATQGVWVEPVGLRNFAIVDPTISLGVTIPPPPATPFPNLIAWGVTIYYKPDASNSRDNWPQEMFADKAVAWPPELSRYTTSSLRQISSYFLYEQWHPELDDPFLRPLGLPRFAIKLYIPRLTLIDVLMMYADIQLSMYTGRGIDVPSTPPAAASLLSSVNDFLAIDMSVQAELSLVESSGVPEWSGEPVNRGLYLNMSSSGSGFLGFSFDFHLEALLRLPNPSPSRAAAFTRALMGFFENPMGVVTGEVDMSALGLQFGIMIEAEATLPFFPSHIYFFGKISLSSFELRGSASFSAGPFSLDVNLEIIVSPQILLLEFGGALELGPLGSISVYGGLSSSPQYFYLNGTFCRPMLGFDMEGSAAIDSRTQKARAHASCVQRPIPPTHR